MKIGKKHRLSALILILCLYLVCVFVFYVPIFNSKQSIFDMWFMLRMTFSNPDYIVLVVEKPNKSLIIRDKSIIGSLVKVSRNEEDAVKYSSKHERDDNEILCVEYPMAVFHRGDMDFIHYPVFIYKSGWTHWGFSPDPDSDYLRPKYSGVAIDIAKSKGLLKRPYENGEN